MFQGLACKDCQGLIQDRFGACNFEGTWHQCVDCFKIEIKARVSEDTFHKSGSTGLKLNRDETERIWRKHFRFQPTKRDKLIQKHRQNVAKNTKGVLRFSKRQTNETLKASYPEYYG